MEVYKLEKIATNHYWCIVECALFLALIALAIVLIIDLVKITYTLSVIGA